MDERELIIVGGGASGLSTAISAYESGVRDILIIDREDALGGKLNLYIHSGFGKKIFNEELTGTEVASKLLDKLKEYNIEYKNETSVIEIDKNKNVTYVNPKEGVTKIKCKALCLCTGSKEGLRGSIKFVRTKAAGVYSALTCQRFINKQGYMPGKRVVILGSSDTALILARRIMLEGSKVLGIIEPNPYPVCSKKLLHSCAMDFSIPIFLSYTITSIKGEERVEGFTVAKVDEYKRPIEGTEDYIDCDTIVMSFPLFPENDLLYNAHFSMFNKDGSPMVNDFSTETQGIFAVGNLLNPTEDLNFCLENGIKAGNVLSEYIKGFY